MREQEVDALVVGGGPAGLAAALWLGRMRCRTLVADRREPRNRWVDATHGYLGFDGDPPAALLEAGRRDLARYGEVEVVDAGVRSLDRADGGFEAELDDGRVRARAVVLATGVADVVPPLEGLRSHYGTHVFVCPMCDGYEVKGRRVAVLGTGGSAGAFAEQLLRWASSVVLVPLGEERPLDALASGVDLTHAPAASVEGDDDSLRGVVLADGAEIGCDAVFLRSETVAVTDLAAHVGCQLDDEGLIVVDADGRTTVELAYAAGDCTPGPQLVQVAAAEGTRAGLDCARAIVARR